jgi:ABC-type branched-subunit amino acid transport system ATPase component
MPTLAKERPVNKMMLELRGISASYGAIQALFNVSLKVPEGGIVAH